MHRPHTITAADNAVAIVLARTVLVQLVATNSAVANAAVAAARSDGKDDPAAWTSDSDAGGLGRSKTSLSNDAAMPADTAATPPATAGR